MEKANVIEGKILSVIDDIHEQNEQREEYINDLKNDMQIEFKQRIDLLLEKTFLKYDKVQKSFSKFFNSDELEVNFSRKADVE